MRRLGAVLVAPALFVSVAVTWASSAVASLPVSCSASAGATSTAPKRRKLSYKEQRELDQIPELMDKLEQRQQALEEKTSAADFYQGDHRDVQAVLDELAAVQSELEATLERWTELEDGA